MSIRTEILLLGRLRLRPGVGYTVIASFVDDDAVLHEATERWIFIGLESPKMYPGYVLHVKPEGGAARSFRLRWGSGGQADVMNAFDEYVRAPTVTVYEIFAALSAEDAEKLEGDSGLIGRAGGDAYILFDELCRLAGNAGIASDRSGIPNSYGAVAQDLSRLAFKVDQSISDITQGRIGT
jgi:hypothetical protein